MTKIYKINSRHDSRIEGNNLIVPVNFLPYIRNRDLYVVKFKDDKFLHLCVMLDSAFKKFEKRNPHNLENVYHTILNKNKIYLTDKLMNYAGLEDKVTIIGIIDKFSLWNPETFEEYRKIGLYNYYDNGIRIGFLKRMLKSYITSTNH